MEQILQEGIKPRVEVKEVMRFLGARGRAGSPRLKRKIRSMLSEADVLLEPRVYARRKKVSTTQQGAVLIDRDVPLKSRKVAKTFRNSSTAYVFVATVGEKVDRKIRDLMKESSVSDASILDAIASAAVEKMLDQFQTSVDKELARLNLTSTIRFSPGYCDWNIKEQHKIFKTIDAGTIGVTLTPSALMHPRKSVSGVFGVTEAGSTNREAINPCLLCGNKDCNTRRIES